jgi:hypothetical protein
MNPFLMAGGLSLFILAEFVLTVCYPLLALADQWLSDRVAERRAIRVASKWESYRENWRRKADDAPGPLRLRDTAVFRWKSGAAA